MVMSDLLNCHEVAHDVDQPTVLGIVLTNHRLADAPQAEGAKAVPLILLGADRALDLGHLEICHLPGTSSRLSARTQHARGSDVLERQTATGRHLFGALQLLEGRNGRVHDVDGVVAAERLRQDVMDTGALQHGARRATGDHTGTGRSRTQHDHTGRRLTLDRVGDGRADHRNAEEALARFLDALLDGRGNFLGLAGGDTHPAVADDDQGGEAEATTTLHDLGDAVDRDDALELVLLGRVVPTVAAAAVAAPTVVAAALGAAGVLSGGSVAAVTPLTSRHQTFLPLMKSNRELC